MLRIEIYSLIRGTNVRVIGGCSVADHSKDDCPGASVSTRVYDEELDQKGLALALHDAVGLLLHENPEITRYADH